jgi:diguanylate cyclase (GGDEF)-like protein/PAS domain S-box-containing protein
VTERGLRAYAQPLQRIKRHALWLAAAFFFALAYFAAHNLLEKAGERNDARAIQRWTQTSVLFNQLIHELQKERGLSSGLIAAGGMQFGPALSDQHRLTDLAIGRMRERLYELLVEADGLAHAVERTLSALDGLGTLRIAVFERRIYREQAVASYTKLIEPLFEQLLMATSAARSSRILRQQIAFLSFLQVKEMAGQERALLTAMLSAGNYDLPQATAFHRIKAEEQTWHRNFLHLADPDVVTDYEALLRAPHVAEAEQMRQLVFAGYAGEEPPGGMVSQAARWFDLATRKIDSLADFEHTLSERLLRDANAFEADAQGTLLVNALGVLFSLALACVLILQLWRGKELAERDLELAAQVFDNSVESIIITDEHTRIVEVNQAFTRISGYERADVIGQKARLLNSGRHDSGFYAAMWDKLVRTGAWEGEVWKRRKNGEVYPALQSIVAVRKGGQAVTHYIAMIVDLTKYKETEAMLEKLRTFDPLTGLPNRDAWRSALDQAIANAERNGGRFALIDIGLDRFKLINESLGHGAGDDVLIGAAEYIRRLLRRHDVAARLGGDRFAILLPDLDDAHSIGALCERLLAMFRHPILAHDKQLHVSISLGVALYPADGKDSRTLLRNAETALNSAKESGRGSYKFYSTEMNAAGARLLALEQLLRQALDRNEFSLVYQPQVAARDGRLIGVEALLRWRNPELGMISPVQFIPIAEATGIIVPIGEWVLREACAQAQAWRSRYGLSLQVAVNLSARQFLSSELQAVIRGALDETGLPPELLELEITEGLLMNDPIGAACILERLRDMKLKIALDDFGTGYSSLAYLKNFPLDRLKLDRAFVMDLPQNESDRAISHTVIALGHNLGLEVLAEGIETEAQRDFLTEAGCDCFQGYLFARPMSGPELEAWLQLRGGAAHEPAQAPGRGTGRTDAMQD